MKVVATIGRPCPDCGVRVGKPHKSGCDVARCVLDGEQRLQHELFGWRGRCEDGCAPDTWSGEWPGVQECEEWGWYSIFVPGQGWVIVPEGTPEATADLNRLHRDAQWDRETQKWVKK